MDNTMKTLTTQKTIRWTELKYVWVMTQKGLFVSNAVVPMDLSYSVLSYPNSEDSHIVWVSSGRFTLDKTFSVDQNCGKKMSIPVHDKKKTQMSKLETYNMPFSHAMKKLWDISQDFGQHICSRVNSL